MTVTYNPLLNSHKRRDHQGSDMFITFEGSEGSGKTTQIRMLEQSLIKRGYSVLTTRQPGGTDIGTQIRAVIHNIDNDEMSSKTEILLYAADRAQHVSQVLSPALKAGQVILCDRYVDSTIAYQGYGREIDLDTLSWISNFATDMLAPDLTFYLDVDIDTGLTRRNRSGEDVNRMDLQKRAFYDRVMAGYEALIHEEPDRWVRIDANRSIEAIQADLLTTLLGRITPA